MDVKCDFSMCRCLKSKQGGGGGVTENEYWINEYWLCKQNATTKYASVSCYPIILTNAYQMLQAVAAHKAIENSPL